MSFNVDNQPPTGSTGGYAGGELLINEEGELFAEINGEQKPVNAFGQPLPAGSKPLVLNEENILTNSEGEYVNPDGSPAEEGSSVKWNGNHFLKVANGQEVDVKQLDQLSQADGAGETNRSQRPYTDPIGAPTLRPPEGLQASGAQSIEQLLDTILNPVSKEEVDAVYTKGIELLSVNLKGQVGSQNITLESLMGEGEKAGDMAALLRFIRENIYFTEPNGELELDESGYPIKMTPEEFFEHLAENPELWDVDISNGKTLKDFSNDFSLIPSVFLNEFLDVIMTFLVSIKKVLQSLSFQTQGQMRQTLERHLATVDELKDATKRLGVANQEAAKALLEAQEQADKAAKCNVATMVIGIVTSVVGVVLSIATMGVATPFAIAMVVVSTAASAITVVDAIMGGELIGNTFGKFIQGMIKLVTEVLDTFLPEDVARFVATALVILIVIVITVILFRSGGGRAGSSIANHVAKGSATLTAETAKAATRVTFQQTVLQIFMLVSTNFNSAIMLAWEESHPGEEPPKWLTISSMALSFAVSFASAAVLLKTAGNAAKTLGQAAKEMKGFGPRTLNVEMLATFGGAVETVMSIAGGATSIAQGVSKIRQSRFLEQAADRKADAAAIEELITQLKEVALKLMGLDEKSLSEFMDRLNDEINHFSQAFSKFIESLQSFEGIFRALIG